MRRLPGVLDLFGEADTASSHCRICGRELSSEDSRAAGIGPVCSGKNHGGRRAPLPREEETPMLPRARYTTEVVDGVICIEDQDDGRSVTNDADLVVSDLGERGFDVSLPCIYRDTMGTWSRIVIAQGEFAGIVGLGRVITCRQEAITAVKGARE